MLGRICGWVATTCIASMNASWATFQLQRRTLATWTWTKRSSSGHRAKWSASSPTYVGERRRRRVGVDEHEPAPRRRPARSRRPHSAGSSTWGKSHAHGMFSSDAVDLPAEAVERAAELGRPAAALGPQQAAAVQAHVVERLDRARAAAHDEVRTPGDVVDDVVTDVRGGAPRGRPSATCGPTPWPARAGRTRARCSARPARTSDRRRTAARGGGSRAPRCCRCPGAPGSSAPGHRGRTSMLVTWCRPRHPSKPAGTGMSFMFAPPGTCGPASHRHMCGSAEYRSPERYWPRGVNTPAAARPSRRRRCRPLPPRRGLRSRRDVASASHPRFPVHHGRGPTLPKPARQ